MTEYKLYLESGPKMKTTMVHVLELLGCLANGPTTQEALDRTPDEIRHYLRFLKRHGEKVDPDAKLTTSIATHVTEGSWIGYGDPAPGFAPDFEPLTRKELPTHTARLRWLGEDIASVARKLSTKELRVKPEKGRALGDILGHIGNTQQEYVRVAGLGKPEEMKAITKQIESNADDPEWLAENISRLFELSADRFEQATNEELRAQTQRGEKRATARRGLRRGLEHGWEHLREIERRLEGARR